MMGQKISKETKFLEAPLIFTRPEMHSPRLVANQEAKKIDSAVNKL